MEWRYAEKDYLLLWADAAYLEKQLITVGRKSERGPRAVWAALHEMSLQEMNEKRLRMPAWASRALRHPEYIAKVENLTRCLVLESDLAATVALKNLVAEGKQRAALALLQQLTLAPLSIPPNVLITVLKTLQSIDDGLKAPEEGAEGEAKSPEVLLVEEEERFRASLAKLPPAWQEKRLAEYRKLRGHELVDERVDQKVRMARERRGE